MVTLKQSYQLLVQDKEYLARQITELSTRATGADDRLQTAWRQLEEAKTAREDTYDRLVKSRDQCRSDYEMRLKDELDALRMKSDHEIARIKVFCAF